MLAPQPQSMLTPATVPPLLEVTNLHVQFATHDGLIHGVDGATFAIPRGKTVCVVGESGCGKSVTARAILQVIDPPGRITDGRITFYPPDQIHNGGAPVDLTALGPRSKAMRALRGKEIAMIYQEPMSSLSPLYTIGNQIMEAIRWHLPVSKAEARERAIAALAQVGIPRPHELIDAYTFSLSGGMRQRAMIAMALACSPKLLIADEPTTALDVTTQANILDLLRDLQAELAMSMMFITHDLGVVAEMAHEVVVMYLGAVVERGPVDQIFGDPQHPYTRALLRSIPRVASTGLPVADRRQARLDTIRGSVPSPLRRLSGCPFHDRCDFAKPGVCDVAVPSTILLDDGARAVRCWAYDPTSGVTLDAPLPLPSPSPSPSPSPLSSLLPSVATDPNPPPAKPALLEVHDLKMHFPIHTGFFNRVTGHVKAVDGVSFAIHAGETLGLVGESGCGKTTLGHTLMRLYAPTAGEIRYHSGESPVDLARLEESRLKPIRRDIRMIFQDPYASLNPRLPIVEIIGEVLKVNGLAQGKELEDRVRALMGTVGLSPDYLHRYPHAFSGGQRQRIGIARALASHPRLIVADEPVSALDVSVQAQILNLLKELQAEFNLTYLFISHDLNVVAHISDRVMVMYVGKVVEMAPTAALFAQPRHPYTEALLSAVLLPDPSRRNTTTRIHLEGSVADPANPPSGCAFHPRCRYAQERCRIETPALRSLTSFNLGEATPPGFNLGEATPPGGHAVACHLAEELTLRGVTFFNLGEATPPGFNLGEATPPGPVASLSPTPT